MDEHIVRYFQASEVQHGGPEQRMKVGDVFADEVILFGRGIRHEGVKIAPGFVEVVFQRGQISNRRVQPHVKILARRIGNLDAEIGGIAADIPVAKTRITLQPFPCLVRHFGLQARRVERPVAQELAALGIGQLKEVMLGGFHHWRGASQRRVGVLQLGRRIDRAADFAGITILIFCATFRTFALDVPVRQEHVLERIIKLLDRARSNQLCLIAQTTIDVL